MRFLAVAGGFFAIAVLAGPSPGHRLHRQPLSIQLIHRIDHAKQRVNACTDALAWRRHRVVGQRYQQSGTPIVWRERVLGYWRSVARRCERHVLPWTNDWLTAVAVVQRVFPGTASWLRSCSAAESRHGSWVWNGSAPLRYVGERRGDATTKNDRAGGYLQFRYSTYIAHEASAFATSRARGFAVPKRASYWDALGQAVVGAFMRWSGQDDRHWEASWGRGC